MMQMISEVYDLLRRGAGFTNPELQQVFTDWNEGMLKSFLIKITAEVFHTGDEATPGNDDFLVDAILDQAGSKGTGKWTSQEAMNLPVAIPVIDAAVALRNLSVYKSERKEAAKIYQASVLPIAESKSNLINMLEGALHFGFIMAYSQGLGMLSKASTELAMQIPLPAVIQVWKQGCIIRSAMLPTFEKAYVKNPLLSNLLLDREVAALVKTGEESMRKTIGIAVKSKITVASLSSALAYFDAYCSERLPTNLIQAQRDFFGAHTYQRIDKEGFFHTEWSVNEE
jgi:6-phosphogluconate dehydrogenase